MSRSPIFRETQARLRDFIREQDLSPGDRLPSEATLAAELGVSRLSLREATRSLQTLGVIEAQPGNGLFVSSFSFRPLIDQLPYGMATHGVALEELLTVREAMEVGLMPVVLRVSSAAELEVCADLARRMIELEETGESTVATDRSFHIQLYKSLDNPLVDSLIEAFWELYVRLGNAVPEPADGGRGQRHLNIVMALQSGEAMASIRTMQEHFDDVRARAAALDTRTD